MAIFNPQVQPLNPPEWTNISRPISDVQADKSAAIGIATGAELVDSATKASDSLIKSEIKSDVYESVDRLRDGYTDALKQYRNMQIASNDPQSLLPENAAYTAGGEPPTGLQQGIDRVKQIGTALAQNGTKLNDTLYTGALNSEAKRLRTQYPGYRDYIDDQIKSVTGVDPANAFMKNLMEDINRNQESNKTLMNSTLSTLRSNADNGFHDANGVSAANVMSLVTNGVWTPDKAMDWLNSAKKLQYDISTRAAARKDRQEDEADQSKTAVKDAGDIATKIVNQGWSTMRLGKGTNTFAGMSRFLQEHAGDQNITDEMARSMGQQMQALRNQMYQSAWNEAQKAGLMGKGGENADNIRKALDARFHPLDLAVTSVFNKDWGSAYSHMNFNEAIGADSVNLLNNASDDDVRRYNRMSLAIGKTSPQAAAQFFQSNVLGGVPKSEKEYLKNMKLELLTQPDLNQGSVSSAQGALDKMRQRGATSPKTYSDFVDTIGYITDKNWDITNRVNIARGFFDPVRNQGLLSDKNFQKDYIDQSGRQVPGKYSVFSKLSSPAVASAMKELGGQRPDLVKDYEVMMSREFGEQLFSREIKDLGSDNANVSANRGYKIGYVNQQGQVPRFAITDLKGRELNSTEALTLRAPLAAINRLNTGISGLYNVYGAAGSKDPSIDVLNTMYKYGYQQAGDARDLNQGWTGEASDVPRMIWNSLVASQQDRLRKAGEAMRKKEQ